MNKLLTALFLLASPVLAANQSDRFFDNTGGLVDRYSPILVPVKSASDIQNIHFDTRGQLLKRNGYDLNNTNSLTASTVTGAGYHQASVGSSFFTVIVGSNIYTTGNTFGGTYTNVTGTTTITAGIDNLAQYTDFKDMGVFCNDLNYPTRVTASAAFQITAASTIAKTCEGFNNYLVTGNTQEGSTVFSSRLRWSDLNDINTWPANNFIDIEPDDGDSIVAIKRYQNNLYILKKKSIYEAIITGGSGAEAFIVRPIARGIGAYSKMSVKAIENRGLVFLGQNGVYLFDGNDFTFISDPIQRKFDGLNRTRYTSAVGEVYPKMNQYWLAVSEGSASQNQTIFVWDYIQEAWSVYKGMNVNMLSQAEDSNGNILLFSGDYAGKVYKQDTGVSDEPNGVTTSVSAFYASSNISLGSPEIDKNFKYLYLYSKATTSSTITLDMAYNFSDTFTDSQTLDIGSTGAVWGTAVWGTDNWPGTSVQVQRIEINRTGKAIRLKFSNSSTTQLGILGWAIVYSLEDFNNE